MRLQAFLARAGAAPSRRKGEALISAGRIEVNGSTASLGTNVSPDDRVLLDGRPVELPETATYLAFNKPAGYLTSLGDDRGRPTVKDLLPPVPGLVPVGRLDGATTGLLILTNDGPLAHRISHPSTEIEKEYHLTIGKPATEKALSILAAGPVLDDGPMLPPRLTNLKRTRAHLSLNLTIHEGRNRIIRRACDAAGLRLLSLQRVRVGPVWLDDLPEGGSRPLTGREIGILRGDE
ncbi:MAG: pseudouridine synthase [Rubrobacteraceae bacterium]